jgi:hypothetical protein
MKLHHQNQRMDNQIHGVVLDVEEHVHVQRKQQTTKIYYYYHDELLLIVDLFVVYLICFQL